MKKLITIIVLTTILVAGLTYTAILYAAPGDVEIKLVIPAAKVADFSAGFLAKEPIPIMKDPASTRENPLPDIPRYTEKQWIREWLRRKAMAAYRLGKIKLSQESATWDPNAISKEQ